MMTTWTLLGWSLVLVLGYRLRVNRKLRQETTELFFRERERIRQLSEEKKRFIEFVGVFSSREKVQNVLREIAWDIFEAEVYAREITTPHTKADLESARSHVRSLREEFRRLHEVASTIYELPSSPEHYLLPQDSKSTPELAPKHEVSAVMN